MPGCILRSFDSWRDASTSRSAMHVRPSATDVAILRVGPSAEDPDAGVATKARSHEQSFYGFRVFVISWRHLIGGDSAETVRLIRTPRLDSPVSRSRRAPAAAP